MNTMKAAVRTCVLSACLISCAWAWKAPAAEEKWQSAVKWCTRDVASPGAAYLAACKDGKYDQFDSVITCQQDAKNEKLVRLIQAAGRSAVNSYMDDYKPKECKY
jgi:hypothetical protein